MADMKISEVLKAALELLGPEGEHWRKGYYGFDDHGRWSDSLSEAVCFCGIGAVFAVVAKAANSDEFVCSEIHHGSTREKLFLSSVVPDSNGEKHWPNWQDRPERTWSEVKEKFLEAIALAEAEEIAAQAQQEAA